MNHNHESTERQTLAAVQKQFADWRDQRKRGWKIPKQLWQAAVQLTDRHSAGEIAAVLGLNLDRFEKRISSFHGNPQLQSNTAMGFVSVGTVSMAPTTVVELEDGTGRMVKVHLSGAPTGTVIEVAKGLWEQLR